MNKYPFDAWTRVAFPPAVADISAPTIDELTAVVDDYYLDVYTEEYIGELAWAYDLNAELALDGLVLPKVTESVDATPWKGGLQQERPTRYGIRGARLEGFRRKPPAIEVLWEGARFKEQRVLVIRRGVRWSVDWTAGDKVEVYRVIIGKRFVAPSAASAATTFTVPLFVTAEDDDAVLVA